MPTSDERSGRNYYLQVSESIKSVFDLTTRVDERVQLMMKKQDDFERKLDERLAVSHALDGRIKVLESRIGNDTLSEEIGELEETVHKLEMQIAALQIASGGSEDRWKTIVTFVIQIAWVLLAAYLLTKLGLQAPAVP